MHANCLLPTDCLIISHSQITCNKHLSSLVATLNFGTSCPDQEGKFNNNILSILTVLASEAVATRGVEELNKDLKKELGFMSSYTAC